MSDGPITERGDPRDRISNQRELFDAAKTTHTSCPVCHAVRLAGQDRAPKCLNDLDRSMGNYQTRPKACLNQFDPTANPWPEGF